MIRLRSMTENDLPLFQAWLSAPHVARWYANAADWIAEVEGQDGVYRFIHHFIAENDGTPVGFCQYYACNDSGEPMAGYTALGGAYSIDYLIGRKDDLRKGYGKQIVSALVEKILQHPDAIRIVVQPEKENQASRGLLCACGFVQDTEKDIYVKTLQRSAPIHDRHH